MNKKQFLDLLRYYLRSYPANIINDIVSDYEDHFREGMQNGKTEEEIARELGNPFDIANEYLSSGGSYQNSRQNSYANSNANAYSKNPFKKHFINFNDRPQGERAVIIILAALAAIALSPFIFAAAFTVISLIIGLVFGAIGIVLGLIFTLISLLAVGVALIVGLIVPLPYAVGLCNYSLSAPTSIFFGIFLISASILGVIGIVKLTKLAVKGIKKVYLSIKWKIGKWGEKSE